MFSCEFYEIFKNTFLTEYIRATGSALTNLGIKSGNANAAEAYLGHFQISIMELRAVNYFHINLSSTFHRVRPIYAAPQSFNRENFR